MEGQTDKMDGNHRQDERGRVGDMKGGSKEEKTN